MVHVTGTRTTSYEIVRGVAIKGDVLHGLSERQGLLVLHQHHTLGGGLTGDLGMSLEVGLVGELITLIAGTLLDEVEDAGDVAVEIGLSEFAALHTGNDAIELLGLTRLQHIVTCPHLNGTVLTTEPVGHHGSFIAPFIAEDGLHEVFALR